MGRAVKLFQEIDQSRKKGTYGIVLASGPQAAYDWNYIFMERRPVKLVKQEVRTGDWYATYDSPEAVTAMDYYLRLISTPWKDKKGNQQYGYCSARR